MKIYFTILAVMVTFSSYASHERRLTEIFLKKVASVNDSEKFSPRVKSEKLIFIYNKYFSDYEGRRKIISDEDIRLLFKTSYIVSSYTIFFRHDLHKIYMRHMELYFSELQRRGILSRAERQYMFKALLASDRFDDARTFRQAHPSADLPMVPIVEIEASFDATKPSVYALDTHENKLKLRSIDISHGLKIVVVAGCHFAEDAARKINADPVLRRAFDRGDAIWVQANDGNLDLTANKRWNAEFPKQELLLAHQQEQWKGIDFSQIPEFYIFKDGKLVAHASGGWTQDEKQHSELMSALRKAALLK